MIWADDVTVGMLGLTESGAVRRGQAICEMGQNFLSCDREQALLMPPSLREWLAEDHFAWFVLDTVDALDLAAFYAD